MEGLACHSVVEVHLYSVLCHLKNDAWDNSTHAVHHRNCVARYEKVLADLTIDFKCSLWKVNDSAWVDFAISVSRGQRYIECVAGLHSLDMLFKLREKASCSVDIVKWSFLYCLVNYLSVYFEFIHELYYFVLSDLHNIYFYNLFFFPVALLLSMKPVLFMDKLSFFLFPSMKSAVFMDRPICRPFRFSNGISL